MTCQTQLEHHLKQSAVAEDPVTIARYQVALGIRNLSPREHAVLGKLVRSYRSPATIYNKTEKTFTPLYITIFRFSNLLRQSCPTGAESGRVTVLLAQSNADKQITTLSNTCKSKQLQKHVATCILV